MNNIGITVYAGLGNQLFKIFTVISYCIDNYQNYILYAKYNDNGHRKYYWDTLFSNISHKVSYKTNISDNNYNELSNSYNKLPIFSNDTLLDGYFQSHKYFEHNINKIKDIIGFDEKINNVLIKYPEYTVNKTISVHYRMGDFKDHQNYNFPIQKSKYYIDAFKTLISRGVEIYDHDILFFCEKEDNATVNNYNLEINNALKELTGKDLRYKKVSDNIPDWEQLLIMTSAKHYIIGNSTFSWFGAYLSSSNEPFVCYPETWFRDQIHDKGLDNWINIEDK
jgi:hypothetical protein